MRFYLVFGIPLFDKALNAERELLISESVIDFTKHAFVVTLQYCLSDPNSSSFPECVSICNGSLIAPNVVLTAGSCIYDTSLRGPPVPLANQYVLVGSSTSMGRSSSNSKYVSVSQLINKGYGMNAHYPLDDNVGLIILSDCLNVSQGVIEFAKVSTLANEAVETCNTVKTIGAGVSSDVPLDVLVFTDGKFRYMHSSVHSIEVCQAEYASQVLWQKGLSRADVSEEVWFSLTSTIIGDSFLCSGGESVASTCFGDSGGAVMGSNGSIVGVSTLLPSGFCGYGAEFSTRVAPFDSWISNQIQALSNQCNWNVQDSFASWPIQAYTADMYTDMRTSTRCSEFQCAANGACVDSGQVCDGQNDCADGSDEDLAMCGTHRRLDGRNLAPCSDTCPNEDNGVQMAYLATQDAAGSTSAMTALRDACEALFRCDSACTFTNYNACRGTINWFELDANRTEYANAFDSKYSITCTLPENQPGVPESSDGDTSEIIEPAKSSGSIQVAAVIFIIHAIIIS